MSTGERRAAWRRPPRSLPPALRLLPSSAPFQCLLASCACCHQQGNGHADSISDEDDEEPEIVQKLQQDYRQIPIHATQIEDEPVPQIGARIYSYTPQVQVRKLCNKELFRRCS